MRVAQHSILVRRCLVWWIGVISTIVLAATYTPLPQECVIAHVISHCVLHNVISHCVLHNVISHCGRKIS